MARVKWGWMISSVVFFAVFVALTVFAQQATKVIRYTPNTQAKGMREGKCWTSSIAISRPDAYRCMIGNEIVDPCFASADKRYAVCNPNPAKGDPGFSLKLTEPLPKPDVLAQSTAKDSGWLVELGDGTICRPSTGASFQVEGKTASYYCEGHEKGKETVLLDGLNAKKSLWTAEKATIMYDRAGPKLIKSDVVPVKTVWQ